MKNNKKVPVEKVYYKCKWCGQEKTEAHYFRRNIEDSSYICKECLDKKFSENMAKKGKVNAVLVLSHYMNIPFDFDIASNLKVDSGIGEYARIFNLIQNKDKNFDDSIIRAMDDIQATKRIQRVSEIADRLEDCLQKLRGELNGQGI